MLDETTDLLAELHDRWDGEHDTVGIVWGDGHAKLEVHLVALIEYDNPHNADWAEYTWIFPDHTLAGALHAAVAWCRELEKLRRCDTCDGQGWYWTAGELHAKCESCDGTGLAHPPAEVPTGG